MTLLKKLDYILDKNFKKKTFFIISIIFFSTILEVVGISLVIPFFLLVLFYLVHLNYTVLTLYQIFHEEILV